MLLAADGAACAVKSIIVSLQLKTRDAFKQEMFAGAHNLPIA